MRTSTAVKYFGTKVALARALGIRQQSLTDWGTTVPLARQYQLEQLTGGALRAPRLKPLPIDRRKRK